MICKSKEGILSLWVHFCTVVKPWYLMYFTPSTDTDSTQHKGLPSITPRDVERDPSTRPKNTGQKQKRNKEKKEREGEENREIAWKGTFPSVRHTHCQLQHGLRFLNGASTNRSWLRPPSLPPSLPLSHPLPSSLPPLLCLPLLLTPHPITCVPLFRILPPTTCAGAPSVYKIPFYYLCCPSLG